MSSHDDMINAMLDLAESAMRTCIEHGGAAALGARAARLLGGPQAATAATSQVADPSCWKQAGKEGRTQPAGLDEIELSRILGALKDQRHGRVNQALNIMARSHVLREMRRLAGIEDMDERSALARLTTRKEAA